VGVFVRRGPEGRGGEAVVQGGQPIERVLEAGVFTGGGPVFTHVDRGHVHQRGPASAGPGDRVDQGQ
jgi:hypothetical protein